MSMVQEFKAFISRGGALELAVGVIIGGAFGKIVTSLTDNVIMPVASLFTGGADFTRYFIRLGKIPVDYKGSLSDYEALKAAGVPMIGYGDFITESINFLILAWIIFLIVKFANKISGPPADPGPSEVDLLTEIRDELKRQP